MSASGVRPSALSTALVASACALLLAGCGVGSNLTAPVSDVTVAQGIVHGGPNPVVGATVTLYATNASATTYGAAATSLGTATTGSDGSFSITPSGSCPAGQQAYITAAGGDPGSGTNANYLLMAALGDCSTLTGNSVWVDEVTTVAAAYALNNFMTISGATVNIGAPTANNSASPSCSGTGSSMTCTAAGLAHAFQNALNLANSIGASPNGQAYQVPPSNSDAEVPTALINTLANIVEACVNSKGGSSSDTTTACGKLFADTVPPGTTTAPANTLQALVNLAKYPTQNTADLYTIASPQSPYSPTLSSAPTDFSVAVVYKGVVAGSTTTAFGYPYHLVLDAKDNVYIMATDKSSATEAGLAAISSDGATLFAPTFSTTYKAPRYMATDTLGNVWVGNNGSSAANAAVLQYSATDGSLTNAFPTANTYPWGVAVDRQNNVWYTIGTAAEANLFEMVQSSGYSAASFTSPQYAVGPYGIAIDANQNIWTANYYPSSATSSVGVFPNSGTAAAPAYANAGIETTLTGTAAYGVALDASGNAWVTNASGLTEVTPNSTSGVITSVTPGSAINIGISSPRYDEVDGSGNVWAPDDGTSDSIVEYIPSASTYYGFKPCRPTAGATTCATGSGMAIYGPRVVQVDSTGSVWVCSSTNGTVEQVLGAGSPTWPQVSSGHPGVMPQ